jgi:heptosyltransferase III
MLKSWTFPDAQGRCLILAMRHMGDAVIASGFVNALRHQYPGMKIHILGRPELREVFAAFASFDEYIGVDLPVYGHHRRAAADLHKAISIALVVRKRKYTYCINLVGDIRENLIGLISGAKWNVGPVWGKNHLFRKKMTPGTAWWITNRGIEIPEKYSNLYDSLQHFARSLGLQGLEWRRRPERARGAQGPQTIALHPGASHPSRHWPKEKWRDVIKRLDDGGYRMILLGSPHERTELLSAFGEELAACDVEVRTGDLQDLISTLANVDLVVGMDSLSAHVAHSLGVPVVVLNGSAPPSIMTPPGSIALSTGHLCNDFPCYYAFPCAGKDGEYRCCRGIEPVAVFNAATEALRTTRDFVQIGIAGKTRA